MGEERNHSRAWFNIKRLTHGYFNTSASPGRLERNASVWCLARFCEQLQHLHFTRMSQAKSPLSAERS
eukprot:2159954-Pyramimonas_sp.AAC.1